MYELIKIIDAHSHYKSDGAKALIYDVLQGKYGIEYESSIDGDKKKLVRCLNPHRIKDKLCKKIIADVFIVHGEGENVLTPIGNTCIARLCEKNLISNIDCEEYKIICEYLRIKNICFLCNRKTSKGYHKKCIKGKGDMYVVDTEQVIARNQTLTEMLKNKALFKVKNLFGNIVFIRDAINNDKVSKKTLNAVEEFIKEHQHLIDNRHKLLSLSNNCIVKSVKTQRRKPSVKQIMFLEKILNDYDRIKRLDETNTNTKYQQYGYVF